MTPIRSFVYAIGSPGAQLVKIGWAFEPEARCKGIQKHCPVPLSVMWTAHGDVNIERVLHGHFAAQRQYGEWFDLGAGDPSPHLNNAMAAIRDFAVPRGCDSFKIRQIEGATPEDLVRFLPQAAAARRDSDDARTCWQILVVEAYAAGISQPRIRQEAGVGPMDLGWIQGDFPSRLKARSKVRRSRVRRGEETPLPPLPGRGWRDSRAAHVTA